MTAYKQAYAERCTGRACRGGVLVRVPKPTHRALQGGKGWHKGDAVFIKGVWVGRNETEDEHIVLTPGGRVFSRTIRRLEPSRRHNTAFLGRVKGLPWDAQDGIVRGRPRKELAPPPPALIGDTNDANNVPMSETPRMMVAMQATTSPSLQ